LVTTQQFYCLFVTTNDPLGDEESAIGADGVTLLIAVERNRQSMAEADFYVVSSYVYSDYI
jgi:hypothetical protein